MATGTITKYADGNDSGWQELTNSGTFSGTVYYRKIGSFVTVMAYNLKLKTALSGQNQGVTLKTGGIPEGFRPKDVIYAAGIAMGASYVVAVQISTGGNLYFNNKANNGFTTNQTFSFLFSYMTP